MTKWNELPDEAIFEVAKWLQDEPREMAKFSQVDKRSYRLTSNASTLFRQAVQDTVLPNNDDNSSITSWKQLAFYKEMKSSGWLEENRVGFAMASTDIAADQAVNCPIKNSRSRLEMAAKWLQRGHFAEPKFIIDSHCGTLGPRNIAVAFSRQRGVSVVQALLFESMQDNDSVLRLLENKLEFRAWGRRISDIAAAAPSSFQSSPHSYAVVARQGYGWAEVYFDLDGLILPPRPDYYQGISPESYNVDTTNLQLNVATTILQLNYESESDEEEEEDGYMRRLNDARRQQQQQVRVRYAEYLSRHGYYESEDNSSSSDNDDDDDDEMDYDDLSIAEDAKTNDDTMLDDTIL